MSTLLRVLALFPLFSSGCLFALQEALDEDPKADGESCDEDDDCRSEFCRGGMCTASSCDTAADCEDGFVCDDPAAWEEGLSLGFAKGVCVPTCDRCPFRAEPRWICGGQTCGYDASPIVDAGESYEGIVGEPIALHGEVDLDDGRDMVSAQWWLSGTVVATGLDAEIAVDMPGTWSIDLVVTDDASSVGVATATVVVCDEPDCG
jgi:hypothetical protein